MSKMDGLRAMREARYAQAKAGVAQPAARPKVTPPAKESAALPTSSDGAAEGLCGHKGMGGKPCTREQGHAAKSHRYS